MTPAEFMRKWAKVTAKETSAYQSHFDDLCRLLQIAPPLEADPAGEVFCYQKRVLKNAELFGLAFGGGADEPAERGFADVWKKGCFAWEYKGRKKSLEEAYKQLLRYRESLLNPPLLVVCDFDRYIVRTNFNGTVQEVYEFTNAQIDDPANSRILRALFTEPDFLKPQRTTAQVTETLARQIAGVAKSLQKRESLELADARTRAEMNFSQRKNLRIARFLNRVVFCFFAEDTGLLPKNLFSEIAKSGLEDPIHFAQTLETLFGVMAKGGSFGSHKIRHFNGHLFEESTVFELTEDELRALAEAGEADWQFIEPGIMGTLFERALEPELRSQLGAHYTSEADIKTLVEPVLMATLRREWSALKAELTAAHSNRKGASANRDKLAALQKRLATVTVLDPACGSGNFLYVSLQLLLGLEKEVVTFAAQLGLTLAPQVSVQQLRAIEINPYAFELAQVSVQIGFLQWRRDNGFDNDRTPVLQNLEGFQNEDALLVAHFRSKSKTLKAAQESEHKEDDALKFYSEREWPSCDVILSNPPFLGGSRLWEELGRGYQKELWRVYEGRVPGGADLCCYWFEKARAQIEAGNCRRAGLLATQGIRGGANRAVLKRIKETGGIFFAESDRDWILAGASVHVSMVGFDDGTIAERMLDRARVETIHANLTSNADTTQAKTLASNLGCCFIGTKKAGEFEIDEDKALSWMDAPNPHGKPNSDVVRPWVNGNALVTVRRAVWIVDAGLSKPQSVMAGYEKPFSHILSFVKPARDLNKEERTRENFWIHKRPSPEMRNAFDKFERCVAVVRHSKHLIFCWLDTSILPDDGIYIFVRDDDAFFGVLASRIHAVWAFAQGTQVREKASGFRYTPLSCFETFPFPFADDLARIDDNAANIVAKFRAAHYHTEQDKVLREEAPPRTPDEHRAAIAAAAHGLNALRERWLNPPEWIQTRTFPGSADGPWARYIDPLAVDKKTGIGTVRYPRLEPRDDECAARLKKRTLTNLYNERPAWLALAHERLDATVAAAYGWPYETSDEEILERLLELNLQHAAEEAEVARSRKAAPSRGKNEDELL